MFEHLNGNDTIEFLIGIEIIDVTGDDLQVFFTPAPQCGAFDVLSLLI